MQSHMPAQQVLEKVTPDRQEGEKQKAPDADALFSDWTGVRKEDASGSEAASSNDSVPPKKERLL